MNQNLINSMKQLLNIVSPPVYSLVTYDENERYEYLYLCYVSKEPGIFYIIDYTTKTYVP